MIEETLSLHLKMSYSKIIFSKISNLWNKKFSKSGCPHPNWNDLFSQFEMALSKGLLVSFLYCSRVLHFLITRPTNLSLLSRPLSSLKTFHYHFFRPSGFNLLYRPLSFLGIVQLHNFTQPSFWHLGRPLSFIKTVSVPSVIPSQSLVFIFLIVHFLISKPFTN